MRFQNIVYRAHSPKWAHDPVSGAGAALVGGRFNALGTPAFYTALEPETALAEFKGGVDPKFKPCTLVSYTVDCDPIADLTDPAFRSKRGITLADLKCAWALLMHTQTPPSWKIAADLIADGYAGILVDSFATGGSSGTNLVLWKFGDKLPFFIAHHDPDGALPKNQDSWT
ncbi:RES domain-containing protein [Rhizobium sp. S163]|uniref:RES family NAD+ phosphorylase n=1 Tax=Rhizobium sp. S163 TaxID=3055039 RepID=UPI0025A9C41F|nr:RES domain-containing protein [Rhizobium sp. S163]MDM9645702.1 RES domain-containing protein [Rhizobium sp. S163]